jgi:hypothetical protein
MMDEAQGDKKWLVLLLEKKKKWDILGINQIINGMRKQDIQEK